jgi:hypothetical protein
MVYHGRGGEWGVGGRCWARPAAIHARERREKERVQCAQRARKDGLGRGKGEKLEIEVSFLTVRTFSSR